MEYPLTAFEYDDIAATISREGLTHVSSSRIDAMVRHGERSGASATVISVLADHQAPRVVRERAFARIPAPAAHRTLIHA